MTCRPIASARSAAALALLGLALTAPLAARADDDCSAPISAWTDHDTAVATVSKRWGLQPQRLRIDDGCYQVQALDSDGNRLSLLLDPETLDPVELKVKFRPGADPARYLDGARARTAPADVQTTDQ